VLIPADRLPGFFVIIAPLPSGKARRSWRISPSRANLLQAVDVCVDTLLAHPARSRFRLSTPAEALAELGAGLAGR